MRAKTQAAVHSMKMQNTCPEVCVTLGAMLAHTYTKEIQGQLSFQLCSYNYIIIIMMIKFLL
jgi:hypothetical protein